MEKSGVPINPNEDLLAAAGLTIFIGGFQGTRLIAPNSDEYNQVPTLAEISARYDPNNETTLLVCAESYLSGTIYKHEGDWRVYGHTLGIA